MAELTPPAGFLGPGGFQDPEVDEGFLSEDVTNNTTDLVRGEVVRIVANDAITRAQANIVANVHGLVGVTLAPITAGAVGSVVSEGKAVVLLEAALAPAAGDSLWV